MAIGLLLLAFVLVLIAGAACTRGRWRKAVLVTSMVFWFVAFIGFLGLLGYEAATSDPNSDFDCAVPGQDSVDVGSELSWIPPGKACKFRSGLSRPTWWRVPAIAALIAAPIGVLVLWPDDQRPELDRVSEARGPTAAHDHL